MLNSYKADDGELKKSLDSLDVSANGTALIKSSLCQHLTEKFQIVLGTVIDRLPGERLSVDRESEYAKIEKNLKRMAKDIMDCIDCTLTRNTRWTEETHTIKREAFQGIDRDVTRYISRLYNDIDNIESSSVRNWLDNDLSMSTKDKLRKTTYIGISVDPKFERLSYRIAIVLSIISEFYESDTTGAGKHAPKPGFKIEVQSQITTRVISAEFGIYTCEDFLKKSGHNINLVTSSTKERDKAQWLAQLRDTWEVNNPRIPTTTRDVDIMVDNAGRSMPTTRLSAFKINHNGLHW